MPLAETQTAPSIADQTYRKTTLDSGLRVITCNMPHTRSASMIILVGTGSRYEADNEAGISHFIEHLCFKGTEKRRLPQQISEPVEGVGGSLNGSTDQEVTTYWAKVALPHFPEALTSSSTCSATPASTSMTSKKNDVSSWKS